jgi:2-polyprenyl-6-methoxyphenol hydroxylase-like FAD-dependent oxidoreductase
MSPAGGVGINLAIQDAVAAANLLTGPLQQRCVHEAALAAVEKRREFPTRVTQAIQLMAHRGLARVFENPGPIQAPWQVRAAVRIPGIQRAVGYAVGIGVRPEHVHEEAPARGRRFGTAKTVLAAVGIAATAAAVSWAAWKAWNKSY